MTRPFLIYKETSVEKRLNLKNEEKQIMEKTNYWESEVEFTSISNASLTPAKNEGVSACSSVGGDCSTY